MDILSVIKKDHNLVRKIFRDLEKAQESNSRMAKELVEQLTLEIKLHAKAEEITLYRACEDRTEKLHDFSKEGKIEHQLLELTLKKLGKARPGDDEFKALVTVAKELFQHHAEEEEETEIFPKLKKAFKPEELKELGEQMVQIKERLRDRITQQVQAA